jgi:hypothetical protein
MGFEELQREVNYSDQEIASQPEASVMVLTDISKILASPQVVDLFKKSMSFTKKYVKKSAAVGIGFSGPKKVLFDIVLRFSGQSVNLFNDLEEAKNWLVMDS